MRSTDGRPSATRSQTGFSLLEVLAGLLVFVIGITAVLAAVIALFNSSKANHEVVVSGIEATSVAEALRLAPYTACTVSAAPDYDGVLPLDTAMELDIVNIEFLTSSVSDLAAFGPCPVGGDRGVQRITVRATPRSGSPGAEDLVFVKRNDTCAGTPAPGQRC